MSYSSMGIVALLVHLIVNYDVLKKSHEMETIPARNAYRLFLLCVLSYYIIDICWGIFYNLRIVSIAYIATVIYFCVMAFSVFMWIQYVIAYLAEENKFLTILRYVGWIFIGFELIILLINLFYPIAFWFEEDGTYHINSARYINLLIQTIMYFISAVYMLFSTINSSGSKKQRYRTTGFFCVSMTIFVILQAKDPLVPYYSMGCMLGTCLLHTFVLENEKEEQRRKYENLLKKELSQEKALGSARHMAYTDSLTGVKNKCAYLEAESLFNKKISDGKLNEMGVAVFDLNSLKTVNDTLGHDVGDQYIKSACSLICKQFKHSPVYRIGGDEFVAILEGEDYFNHESLIASFDEIVENNRCNGNCVVSCGFDKYIPGKDSNFLSVFERADKKMYEKKRMLKQDNEQK